jgi:hypothetical protein
MIYLIIISVLFGLGRFFIQGHDVSWPGTYEAFAHIWVGILLVFCFSKVKEVRWTSICIFNYYNSIRSSYVFPEITCKKE